MRIILIIISLFLASCGSVQTTEPLYIQPQESTSISSFTGEDSSGKFLGKGHEKIFVCLIDGYRISPSGFDTPVKVEPGVRTIGICYQEGLNTASAKLKADIPPSTSLKVRLGEHSWTEVNFWIENETTNDTFLGLTTVPKTPGKWTILY